MYEKSHTKLNSKVLQDSYYYDDDGQYILVIIINKRRYGKGLHCLH